MNQILNFLLGVADTSKIPEYEKVVNPKVPSFIGMTFKSIIALCLVIGVMFIFVWILRKLKKGPGGFNNNGFVIGQMSGGPEVINADEVLGFIGDDK